MTAPATLPGELAAQIARVTTIREHYRTAERLCGPGMAHAIFMMSASLDAAVATAGPPDIVGQLKCLRDFMGYSE